MARSLAVHAVTDDKALGGALFEKSVRLDRHNTKFFYRTPSSAGNRKTYTFSAWIKRTVEGSTNPSFNRYTAGNEAGFLGLYFNIISATKSLRVELDFTMEEIKLFGIPLKFALICLVSFGRQ